MEQSLGTSSDTFVHALARHELRDFDLIVANARAMGWLAAEQELSVVRRNSAIVVRALHSNALHERCGATRRRASLATRTCSAAMRAARQSMCGYPLQTSAR